jgi:hypothetical protein
MAAADDPFYSPHCEPLSARKPRAGEPLWSARKEHRQFDCELRYHGEFGVEAQILKDGELLYARTFPLRELAVAWGTDQREDIGTRKRGASGRVGK